MSTHWSQAPEKLQCCTETYPCLYSHPSKLKICISTLVLRDFMRPPSIYFHVNCDHISVWKLLCMQTADLTLEWSGWFMFHPLLHIYTKTPFCCIETIAKNALNHWHVVVFDWLWANTTPILNTAFSLTNVHAKWWIHCFLISSTPLISHTTSIYNQPKQVCGVFWCFLGQLPNLSDQSVQHHVSVRPCLKSAYHLLTIVSNGAESE